MRQPEYIDPYQLLTKSRSSGFGMSFYGNFRRCAYRGLLESGAPTTVWADGKPSHEQLVLPNYFAGTGILFAKLLELYRNGSYTKVIFRWNQNDEPESWQEAQRLFRYYRADFPWNEFENAAVEQPFSFTGSDSLRLFGVPRFTGRYDTVVRLKPEQEERVLASRGIPIKAGLYIMDDKVRWKMSKSLLPGFEHRMQFQAYMLAWNATHEEKIRGALGNIVMAYTDSSKLQRYWTTLCPVPGPAEQRALHRYLARCEDNRLRYGFEANPEECFRYENRPCPFHPSQPGGNCDLVGLPVDIHDTAHIAENYNLNAPNP